MSTGCGFGSTKNSKGNHFLNSNFHLFHLQVIFVCHVRAVGYIQFEESKAKSKHFFKFKFLFI